MARGTIPAAATFKKPMLLLASLLIASRQAPESAQAVYDRIKELIRASPTLHLDVSQETNDSWSKNSSIIFCKPNKIRATDGYGDGGEYRCDGRFVWERVDGKVRHHRATKEEREAIPQVYQDRMRGFELFYAPRAKVECIGNARRTGTKNMIAIDIVVDGVPCSVYVDVKTRMPMGSETKGHGARFFDRVELHFPAYDSFFSGPLGPL
jgi:hypothetical protein